MSDNGTHPARFVGVDTAFLRSAHFAKLKAREFKVLVVLASFAGRKGECWPSVARVASLAGIGRSSAFEALKGLVDGGYVERDEQQHGGGRFESDKGATTKYRIKAWEGGRLASPNHPESRTVNKDQPSRKEGVNRPEKAGSTVQKSGRKAASGSSYMKQQHSAAAADTSTETADKLAVLVKAGVRQREAARFAKDTTISLDRVRRVCIVAGEKARTNPAALIVRMLDDGDDPEPTAWDQISNYVRSDMKPTRAPESSLNPTGPCSIDEAEALQREFAK